MGEVLLRPKNHTELQSLSFGKGIILYMLLSLLHLEVFTIDNNGVTLLFEKKKRDNELDQLIDTFRFNKNSWDLDFDIEIVTTLIFFL